jgi:hypothetical protein
VLAEGSSRLGVAHGLEHGAEDGGADAGPVDGAGVEDGGAEVLAQGWQVDRLAEDPSVDVLEPLEPVRHLLWGGRVEEREEVV